MVQVKRAVALGRSLLLLAALAACSDQPVTPGTGADGGAPPAFNVAGRAPRDVPEVRIDLPAAPRRWDRDPAALAEAVSAGQGYAVVAFKEPGSARALATGKRGGVTAGTVRAGLELLRRSGAEVVELLEGIGAARVRIAPDAAVRVAAHPLVDFVEPRQFGQVQAQSTPWGITTVKAPDFWSTTGVTGAGARVLIIDTGHQQGHVDLPAVPTTNCAGLYGGCNDASTANWHGTHVLGIVAARNNADGVVGVAPGITGANVFMYGACDNYGSCPTDEVTAGINAGIWNAQVINLSLGQPYDAAQATSVAQAWANGIVIVAAAGNNMSNTTVYPAAYSNVLGVSGVLSNKAFASTSACGGAYSNYGAHVDLAAPFEAYSTLGGNTYGTLCGTSMAAPHVTGVAALLRSQNPGWTNQQVVDALIARAEDLGAAGRDNYFGHGLVRAVRVAVSITGTSSITSANTYTWQANASGGNGSYAYTWEYRVAGGAWSYAGSGSTYSRGITASDPSFELRVTATSAGLSAYDDHPVTVSITPSPIVTANITGPANVYIKGTRTWQANAAGGNGSYTYKWESRAQSGTTWTVVGSGSSYSRSLTSTSQPFELRVTVTSGGQTGSDTHLVYVEIAPDLCTGCQIP